MILPDVRIYSKLTIGTTVYEENDLHKPYFTATASRGGVFKSFAKDADKLHNFTDVQPRKGKEFSEMELDSPGTNSPGANYPPRLNSSS